ncbi:MAG: DUF47 domain-containing protein [Acidimicrobiia bacterium]
MARLRFRLIPRDEAFFDLFVEHARILVQAAEVMREVVSDGADLAGQVGRLRDLEHEGDAVTRDVMHRLNTSFVTPLDREDIHRLASNMDNVIDYLDEAAQFLHLHNIDKPLPQMRDQAELVVQAARATEEAMKRLPDFRKLASFAEEINHLEDEGDRVYREAVADLFSGEHGAMDVLKWTSVIEALEGAMDQLEDVANVVEGIALKHA